MTMIPEPSSTRPSLRARRLWLVLGGAALLALVWLASASGPSDPPRSERELLKARATVLEAQLALAKEGGYFLVLDPATATLTLFQGGATLRVWPVLDIEGGGRRLGGADSDWRTRRWDGSRVDPTPAKNRRVIISDQVDPPDLTGAVDWIPPTPEEAVPTPHRFIVHYAGGLGVEVLAQATDSIRARPSPFRRVGQRLRDLLPANRDHYRVRLRLEADDAGSLYRSLPDASSFLAALPDP